MALFEVPKRAGKSTDAKIAKKSNAKVKIAPATIKGSGGILDKINLIKLKVEQNLGQYKDEYRVITDIDELKEYIDKVITNKYISIDTETDGLDPLRNTLAGICVYTRDEKASYIPVNHISYITNERVENQLKQEDVIEQFKRIKRNEIDIDMFNASFDIRVLRHAGWKDAFCTWDASIAINLLNENEEHKNLKQLHQKYCLNGQGDAFKFDDLFKGIPFTLIPYKVGYLYAAHDPIITTELCDYQRKYLRPDSDREDIRRMYWVFKNIEMPCVDVVCDMEDAGVLIDLEYNEVLKEKYHKLLDDRASEFHKVCDNYKDKIDAYRKKCGVECKLDNPINIKSSTQLAILMYDILGYDLFYDKKKHKDTKSTAEEALLKHNTDVTKAILSYREFATLVSTFIDKLPECINPDDGRIHCEFKQYGAKTGRFSSKDPNLQNIPSHNKDIRPMFKASDGYVWMSSDFSQQEPKCLAALCKQQGDPQMYNTFMQGKDLYSEIASKAFNKTYLECLEHFPKGTPIKKVDKKWYYATDDDYDKIADGEDTYADGKERRGQAKSILLGVLYGRGEASIAEQLGCTTEKAKQIKESVFRGFPAIKKFEEDSLAMAEDVGYVTTVCGRKRRLPDLQLDEYSFKWKDGAPPQDDLLDFDSDEDYDIPEETINKYLRLLSQVWGKKKQRVFKQANDEGIWIVDNGAKIADASRQCVNSRIQGSAADLTKLAMIDLNNNKRLKELGFRLLIQVHDEVIAECPEENAKECKELLAQTMSKAAEKILEMPIKCDVEVTKAWYGEKVEV